MSRRALLIMAKAPKAGQTKTRLSPPLSLEQAAELYACFLQDVTDRVATLADVDPFFAVAPAGARSYFDQLKAEFGFIVQEGTNLGDRLAHVLGQTLAAGYDQVCAINSDGPTLPVDYLQQAYAWLDDPAIDMVLGPCDDGGYYLIGWKQRHDAVVKEVQMSTPQVLADTLAIARREGLSVQLLPVWFDVDERADLDRLWHSLQKAPTQAPATYQMLQQLFAAAPS